jgi:hypothetical protein
MVCCSFFEANTTLDSRIANSADFIFRWNGCILYNIQDNFIISATVHHVNTGIENEPSDTFSSNTLLKQTACFRCTQGRSPLLYNYDSNSGDKFSCHNFACLQNAAGNFINCDFHPFEEILIN